MTDDEIILSVIKMEDMMSGKKVDFDDLRKLIKAVREHDEKIFFADSIDKIKKEGGM
jgi:hypothetical protein